MQMNTARMAQDVSRAVQETGRTVRHQRHTQGVYDSTKDYQNPIADALSIDENITATWVPKGSNLIIEYFGILAPDEISVLVASTVDLQAADLLVTGYRTSTEKAHKVSNVTALEIQGTNLGTLAIIKLLPSRRVT